MKKFIYLLPLLFVGNNEVYSQQYYQLYYNTDLLAQISLNNGVRLGSEKLYQSSYEKQKELYEDANEKLVQVVYVKNQIYSSLKNVNSALKQGKQLEQIYYDFGKLINNMAIMTELTVKYPQYAILITRFYEKLYLHIMNAYTTIEDQAMKEETNYLMDSYDRQYLLNKVHREIKVTNGWVLHISNYLRKADRKPYFRHIKFFNNWVVQDEAIIKRIITNYGYNVNNW